MTGSTAATRRRRRDGGGGGDGVQDDRVARVGDPREHLRADELRHDDRRAERGGAGGEGEVDVAAASVVARVVVVVVGRLVLAVVVVQPRRFQIARAHGVEHVVVVVVELAPADVGRRVEAHLTGENGVLAEHAEDAIVVVREGEDLAGTEMRAPRRTHVAGRRFRACDEVGW